MASTTEQRDFRPFIPECTKRGIGKTKAYELANAGLLDVFKIGTRTFVYLDSLLTMPQRLEIEGLKAKGITVTEAGR